MSYKFLISPWRNEFISLLSQTKEELFISSPFINMSGINILSDAVKYKTSIHVSLITNLTVQNIRNRITEPKALLECYKQFGKVDISSLGRLHAKVYLIDNEAAIITSANLTNGGLINNFEYGVLIDNKEDVTIIKEDMLKYYSLGNVFDRNFIEKISEESDELYRIEKETEGQFRDTKLAKLLRKTNENIHLELLKNRIRKGKTINAIFSDTILYILKRQGPLSTKELHPFIAAIHPDICDNSIDRVINGQHFGKRWKHLVRGAQQFLIRRKLIYLKGEKWYLAN